MAVSTYSEIEHDLRIRGDYTLIDGTLEVDGATSLDGGATVKTGLTMSSATLTAVGIVATGTVTCTTLAGVTAPTIAGGLTLSSPTVTTTKTLTISSKMTTHCGITIGAPSGTLIGTTWTTGAPELTDGQLFIVLTCGSTDYRIPVWANS